MRIAMFYHSLLSDWNHGNAHFLRGIATDLVIRGHKVRIFEPRDSWSARNLWREQGTGPFRRFHEMYPLLRATRYRLDALDLELLLEGMDIVIVHEWNDPALISMIGKLRYEGASFRLYFHDTHHRVVTDPGAMAAYDLSNYDGVLAYGAVLREMYVASGRVRAAWVWHEAADVRVFHPMPTPDGNVAGDVVWIGNWGDEERSAELREFLVEPSCELKLRARAYGVRYPESGLQALRQAGVEYLGWLPNFEVPPVFSQHKATVHIPRRPYVKALPGIPTIRPFEALACGIPLVCAPWDDTEGLFSPGHDFLVARTGREMEEHLRDLMHDPQLRQSLSNHGLQTIRRRHTCGHRVAELLSIDAANQRSGPEERLNSQHILSSV